jgi:homocysteine S-methyltransferase
LRDAGADAIDVADSPMARMRMSPWAPARLIHEHVGLDTVLHFPTRGRNLLRLQGDLLAAHALGIRNLFITLGDPARIGDYPAASDNVDVVPTGFLELVTGSLNRGVDRSGESIGEPTSFVCGCAVNLAADDLDRECRLLRKKIGSGAAFALSQPVFSADVLRTFRKAYEERHGPLPLPVLVGLLPLVTSKHAEFLHNEVPGISIGEEIRDRMRAAAGERDQGVAIAVELGRELRADAAGIYLVTPFGRYGLAAEVVEAIKDGAIK